ncbi:HPr kinase/phosphatase C-terminal domain-containing protein [Sphingomonas oligophenolica]|uniref:Serine kinase n=1 Tax=Sphingomonas oligophenolica TaxID=301154 RepID=A0ABU9Y1P8_9SPHN
MGSTWVYSFGGLRLRSTTAIDQLRPYQAEAEAWADIALSFETGEPPVQDRISYRWPGRYGLIVGTCGDEWLMTSSLDGAFLISRERRTVRCISAPGASFDACVDVLIRRVLPRVATLFGASAIHAAALARPEGGILLLGMSGAGKSTMTAALGNAGWHILSDDISVMWGREEPLLAPAAMGVCVWPASREGVGLPIERCRPMPAYDGKTHFVPEGEPATVPVPLRALLFLKRGSNVAPALEPLREAQALVAAAHMLVQFDPGDPARPDRVRGFARLNAAVKIAPSYRLLYPNDFAALADVELLLRGLLKA